MEKYKISCKFSDMVLAPGNAVESRFYSRDPKADYLFVTTDGVVCRPEYQCTRNNADGRFDDVLDDFCKRTFDIGFSSLRSMWISRLGSLDNYWDIIKLYKV